MIIILTEHYRSDNVRGGLFIPTNIYLVRHAEIKYTPDDFVRPLSEKGKRDVDKVTNFFKDKVINRVISSPYLRAIDTIKYVALDKGLEIEEIYDWKHKGTVPLCYCIK
ncbi:SixA phosphatase family protein [Caldisalinibacter kiritimatiensis]|uniref:Phosphoglycerate mutase family 2 n=1 Tax=Caldisalinibacter kiritimatiensis TaxID=1304284 RepID=R1CVG1_9FIRM|nr:histidine phosphatase family protein [Caldisalinibacter kiritimatiensis]EOD00634.1 Phosphoglycerate mutase family 2 [Caldisalinibacter kiritimatiensis]